MVGRIHRGRELLEPLGELRTLPDDSPAQRVTVQRAGPTNHLGNHEGLEAEAAGGPPKDMATRLQEASEEARSALMCVAGWQGHLIFLLSFWDYWAGPSWGPCSSASGWSIRLVSSSHTLLAEALSIQATLALPLGPYCACFAALPVPQYPCHAFAVTDSPDCPPCHPTASTQGRDRRGSQTQTETGKWQAAGVGRGRRAGSRRRAVQFGGRRGGRNGWGGQRPCAEISAARGGPPSSQRQGAPSGQHAGGPRGRRWQ